MPPRSPARPSPARAFTLVEILIVIGVLAVLLSIGLPVLRSVRITALEAAVLAHQREVGLEMLNYTEDQDGFLPYYGKPGTNLAPILMPPPSGEPEEATEMSDADGPWGYWGQSMVWWWHLELLGYNGEISRWGPEVARTRTEERRQRHLGGLASFDWMAHGAFANPRYFRRAETLEQQILQQRVEDHTPQLLVSVRFPSRKGLLLRPNRIVGDPIDGAPFVFFADAHGAQLRWTDMREPLPTGRNLPVFDTENGLHGRDL